MKLLSLWTLATSALAASTAKRSNKASDWDYQNKRVEGVNLGGWFVLEPYITPSLFKEFGDNPPVDEYHYTKQLGKDEALKRLKKHWDTWYQELDFKAMAKAGINTVRIPIGYWAYGSLDNDPYVLGQDKYLERAIGWARKHGLAVWIDLHGAPGSQNGFDNSGLRDLIEYQTDENISLTLTVLQKIFDKYGVAEYEDVVSGIQFLNEPLGPSSDMNQLKNFYRWAYGNMRSVSYNNAVIHDAFEQTEGYWDSFMNVKDGYWKVVLDHHHYQVFSAGELGMSIDDHIKTACNWGPQHKNEYHWNVVGEWSAALTDCAFWLNGVGRGARWSGDYDGSPNYGSCAPYTNADEWTDEHKKNVRKYLEAQLDAYSTASGWIFWNWKCEDAVDWDMSELIKIGVFPQPFDDRQYKNQCGY